MNIQKYRIMERHASLCKVLGHPHRLLIIDFLDNGEQNVGDIAEAIDSSFSTTSRHLRLLKQQNVIQSRRDGQTIYYSLKHPEILEACRIIRNVLFQDMIQSGELAESQKADYIF